MKIKKRTLHMKLKSNKIFLLVNSINEIEIKFNLSHTYI